MVHFGSHPGSGIRRHYTLYRIVLLLCLISVPVHAQHYDWVARGETSDPEATRLEIIAIGADSSDNVIVAIAQEGGLTLRNANDSIALDLAGRSSWRRYDLIKYSASGEVLWGREIHTLPSNENNSSLSDLCVDAAGAIYLTGLLGDKTRFSSGDGRDTSLTSLDGYICFVAKYTAEGNLLWATRLPELPPGRRIGTDGDSTLYLLASDHEGPGAALYTFDLDGHLLRRLVDGRLGTLDQLVVDADGNACLPIILMLPRSEATQDGISVVDGHSVVSPSLKQYPAADSLTWLSEPQYVMLHVARDGSTSALFSHPIPTPAQEAGNPQRGYGYINVLSPDDAGRPAFASLYSFARINQLEIAGQFFDRPDTGQLFVTFNDQGKVVHQTRLRFDTYNTMAIRGAENTWLVMGPLLDSLIVRGDTVRSEPFSSHYVKELACVLLDSTLQPLRVIRCGGTAYTVHRQSFITRMHGGACAIASYVAGHATIGGRRITSGGNRRSFYVARIVP